MVNELAMKPTNGGEVIEAERIPERGVTLFGTNDPVKVVEMASGVASALSKVIDDRELFSNISGRKHVRVEGWTLCGSMLGVFPVCIWTRQVEGGWEARVEAKLRDGSVVGAAEAQCTRSEKTWANRDDYAIRSMAQTRATSKALRLPLGFIVSMGGYEATPAEEMEGIQHGPAAKDAPAHVPAPTPKPKPTTPRATRPTPIPESAETATINLTEVKEIKSGKNDKGEPWTMYAINGKTDAGVAFSSSTFDDAVMTDALRLTGQKVIVHYMTKGKYKNALAVSAFSTVVTDPNDLLNEAAAG